LSENAVYEALKEAALEKTAGRPDEDFVIRGLWKVDLAFQPSAHERVFRYAFLVSQTVGQGSCYCDKELVIDEDLIGRDAREVMEEGDCYSISLLDSIYSTIPKNPVESYELRGNSIEKAVRRNTIIRNEVRSVLEAIRAKKGRASVLNIGVVGTLIRNLVDQGYGVSATDLDEKLVGRDIHGVTVEHGSRNFQMIKDADVAVITGMTLTTQALEDILQVCSDHSTKVIMFAETGANFGEEYCGDIGIDVTVSEPFPFYIFQGVSQIDIFRKETT
jgi:hypothetical protein